MEVPSVLVAKGTKGKVALNAFLQVVRILFSLKPEAL